MGNPYLSRNESMILTSHRIFFKAVMNDVILTNQRLILVDTSNPRFRSETIPLTTIETVLSRESGAGFPEITLSVTAPGGGGATIPVMLVFTQKQGETRVQERDEWITGLKEQVALVRERVLEAGGVMETLSPGITGEPGDNSDTGAPDGRTLSEEPTFFENGSAGTPVSGELPEGMQSSGNETTPPEERMTTVYPAGIPPGGPYQRPSLSDRFHPSQPTKKRSRSTVFVLVSVILFVAVIAGAGYFVATTLMKPGNSGVSPGVAPSPVPTQVQVPTSPTPVTTMPTPVITQPVTSQVIPTPSAATTSGTLSAIPQTGVWVRVAYPGDFSGSIGTAGRMNAISGSGSGLFRIPAKNEIVEASVQKLDGSGKTLTVEIYNEGVVAGHDSTSSPLGSIDLHVNLKSG